MPVTTKTMNLSDLHSTASAERFGRQSDLAGDQMGHQSDASTNFLAMQDRGFLKLVLEADPVQGVAIKEIQRAAGPFPGV